MLEVVAYLVCDGCGTRIEAGRGPALDVDPGRQRARSAGWRTLRKLVSGATRRRDHCPDCRAQAARTSSVLYRRVETVDLPQTVTF